MINIFRKKRAPETGEANARRFVVVVSKLAQDERLVTMLPHDGWHGSKHERYGWEWMPNPRWRERVLELLRAAPVKDAAFHAPDSLDGWTFTAISIVPVPRVATLSLEESLW